MLLRDKVESTTDRDARLYKKSAVDKSVPAYQGHALMETATDWCRSGSHAGRQRLEAGSGCVHAGPRPTTLGQA